MKFLMPTSGKTSSIDNFLPEGQKLTYFTFIERLFYNLILENYFGLKINFRSKS